MSALRRMPPPRVETPPARPVDLRHLADQTLGDGALQRQLLDLFKHQASLAVERLRHTQDHAAWASAAHTLKGAAQAIGAWRVAEAAAAAETGPARRRDLLDALEVEVADANAFISALLAGRH